MKDMPTIAALAGRRIDASDTTEVRFPLSSVAKVARALESLLSEFRVEHLICSAACGADLLALDAARRLGIDATIILPFDENAFRETSVTDRPGDWGTLYDHAISRAHRFDTLIDLGLRYTDDDAYDRATARIIDQVRTRRAARRLAIAVWEGAPRGADDATADFLAQARAAHLETYEIATLRQTSSSDLGADNA